MRTSFWTNAIVYLCLTFQSTGHYGPHDLMIVIKRMNGCIIFQARSRRKQCSGWEPTEPDNQRDRVHNSQFSLSLHGSGHAYVCLTLLRVLTDPLQHQFSKTSKASCHDHHGSWYNMFVQAWSHACEDNVWWSIGFACRANSEVATVSCLSSHQ